MAEQFKEEAYVLEKMEISEDEDEDFDYKEIQDSDDDAIEDLPVESVVLDDEDDLNDFTALKAKTEAKKMAATKDSKGASVSMAEQVPRTIERDVVIDDFIRNFLQKFTMPKTLNIFQQEWHDLQKKGTFHDGQIGLITDMHNKNAKLRTKIDTMKVELKEANIVANQAKSTWEQLRKERDFHKQH